MNSAVTQLGHVRNGIRPVEKFRTSITIYRPAVDVFRKRIDCWSMSKPSPCNHLCGLLRYPQRFFGRPSWWPCPVPQCGLRGCKNRPSPFPGCKRRLNQALSLLALVLLCCFHFLSITSLRFYVSIFWLFWLSCQYLPSDGLERLFWGSIIVAMGLSPQSPGRRVFTTFSV